MHERGGLGQRHLTAESPDGIRFNAAHLGFVGEKLLVICMLMDAVECAQARVPGRKEDVIQRQREALEWFHEVGAKATEYLSFEFVCQALGLHPAAVRKQVLVNIPDLGQPDVVVKPRGRYARHSPIAGGSPFSPEEQALIKDALRRGVTMTVLAQQLGVTISLISIHFSKELKAIRWARNERIKSLYASGLMVTEVAKAMGVSRNTICRVLEINPGMKNFRSRGGGGGGGGFVVPPTNEGAEVEAVEDVSGGVVGGREEYASGGGGALAAGAAPECGQLEHRSDF